MNVKIIKSEKDYEVAMARLSDLMARDLKPGSTDEDELELLALVINDFERQTVPPVKADPIESILFRMDQMGLTRKDLIPYIGSISKVSEVLSRKRPLSLPMIRRLHQGLDIPADILIEDVETDCSVVEREPTIDFSRFPLKEMYERGCFGGFEGNTQRLKEYAAGQNAPVVAICAKMEADMSEMSDEDKALFLEEMGQTEPGLNRLIRAAFKLLGLQTYFTAGVKEVRAWTIHVGDTAPQAAGVIHGDFERGFIRAQTIAFDDFIAYKGEQGAKDAGKMRAEGKEYIVKDGDVMNFLFNV